MTRGKRREAMWSAIQTAAGNEPGSPYVKKVHPIWGLRAIRDFERINGVQFDPLDRAHTARTYHAGRHKITLAYLKAQARNIEAMTAALGRYVNG